MVEADDDTTIKIADFGFAKKVTKPFCLRTLCGTAQYVAPEVLDLSSGGYDCRADMWSVGVVVYILLGGYAPFEGPVQELAQAICKADYAFHDKYWSDISDAAKGMISSLLEIDVDRRLSAEEALQCPWMTIEEESLTAKDLSGAQEALQKRKLAEADQPAVAKKPMSKFDSLDVSFTAGLGTIEEVMERRNKVTDNSIDPILEDDESVIEDSSSGKPFDVLYKLGKLIDEGDWAPIYECKHKQSKEAFNVKQVSRSDLDPIDAVALQDEIATLKLVSDSPYIVTLVDVFEEPDYTYMVLESLQGGLLIDRLIERRHYTEHDARLLMRGLLRGVEHCHNRRIAIRNIKTESLLCVSFKNDYEVKLTDFGMAKKVLYPNSLQTQCGTEGYVAPEILEHRPAYDVQCDVWSLGVVLYIIIGGYRPFRGDGEEVLRLIRYGDFKFHKRYWSDISEEAKILISRMLTVNPIARITATGALLSEWIQGADDAMLSHALEKNLGATKKNRESAVTKVKTAVNAIVATKKFQANVNL
jgi:serine/threonine protein kinase